MALPIVAGGLGSVIAGAIIWFLRLYIVSLIGRVLATVGVGLFFYNYAMPEINSFIGGKFAALPDFVRASAGAAGIDIFVSMVVSALAVRQTASFFFGRKT